MGENGRILPEPYQPGNQYLPAGAARYLTRHGHRNQNHLKNNLNTGLAAHATGF